ncbi:MAG TPA: twin-arginine translocase TatA/TatE family subunit [Gammaproteobacteria bacterium]|nr:twin-arginine translocase TatA/TatE family subunit [Gammaproteobacteria bacterium]
MSIGPLQLVLVLIIILLLFGAKRLRNVGSDLGEAIKGFRKSVKEGEEKAESESKEKLQQRKDESGEVIEGEVTHKEQGKS